MKAFTDRKIFLKYRWRGRISHCPHCEKEPLDSYKSWHYKEWVDGIFLSLDMPNWKTDSFAVFSVCPLCQKKSWCHMRLPYHFFGNGPEEKWPEVIKDAMIAEYRKRLNSAIVKWNESPCLGCSAIHELSTTYLYFSRSCPNGSGGPLDKGEKCKSRVERK